MTTCLKCLRRAAKVAIVATWFGISCGGVHSAALAHDIDEFINLQRPLIDLTGLPNSTTVIPVDLVTPEAARNIGPGSALLITIPDEGQFGCTANFVWESGATLYLGAAGHCFLPPTRKATHGEGADYDASGVTVEVCIENCETGFQGIMRLGTVVQLGAVAYARQTDATGEEQVGHDFGVVEIPAELAPLIRRSMPVFGGPTGVDELDRGELGCHYGNGVLVGEVFLTKARVGIGGGSNDQFWFGNFVAAPGDSGSPMVSCDMSLLRFRGRGAVGVLTHLGVQLEGIVFGTTTRRATEMAMEAGLFLSVVLP